MKVSFKDDIRLKGQQSYDCIVKLMSKGKSRAFRMLKVYNPYYDGGNQSKVFKDMPEVASDDAYCVLLTNIEPDALDLEQVYSMYRMRWQIELMFKTYKSGNSFNAGKATK